MDRKQSEQWQSRISRTINSTACYTLAYILLTYLLWFVTGIAGRLYKFDSFIYYYGIKFILNGHAWSTLKVAVVYSSGPVVVLALAMLSLFLFNRMKDIRTLLNVFFLWVFITGTGIFVSEVIIADLGYRNYSSIFYQGLAVSFSWLRMPSFVLYLLNVLAVISIIFTGTNSARPFLAFSFSYSKVNNLKRRRKYFFETVITPYIAGSLLTIVAVFPKDWSAKNVLILLACMHIIYLAVIGSVLGIAWLSLAYLEISKGELGRYKSLQMPNIMAIIAVVVCWAYIYVTLRGVYITS